MLKWLPVTALRSHRANSSTRKPIGSVALSVVLCGRTPPSPLRSRRARLTLDGLCVRVLSSFQRTGGLSGRLPRRFGEPSKHLTAAQSLSTLFSLPANFVVGCSCQSNALPSSDLPDPRLGEWVAPGRVTTGWRLPIPIAAGSGGRPRRPRGRQRLRSCSHACQQDLCPCPDLLPSRRIPRHRRSPAQMPDLPRRPPHPAATACPRVSPPWRCTPASTPHATSTANNPSAALVTGGAVSASRRITVVAANPELRNTTR